MYINVRILWFFLNSLPISQKFQAIYLGSFPHFNHCLAFWSDHFTASRIGRAVEFNPDRQ